MIARWGALLAALAGAILLAVLATTTPAPLPASAPASVFSAERAMANVRAIGRAPHPTGSAEDTAVRDYLAARLRSMGLQVDTPTATMSAKAAERLSKWRGTPASTPPLINIVGLLPGRDRTAPAVLLMAHHDSVWGSPGAADDGAGVASLLESVRAIRAGPPSGRDLIVLLTDGEELGLEGARAFFASDPRAARVGVIVNTETRGGGGRASMFETGAANGDWMRLFGRSVARPVSTSLSVFVYQHLPNSTDYTVAKKRGVPGFNFAFIGRPALYHSPLATPDRLDRGAVQDMGRQVLDLTRGLLGAPSLPGLAPDRTFFDAFGLFLIAYPAWAGWVVLVLAGAGYAVAWRRGARAVGRGAAATLALALVAPILLLAGNLLSGRDGPVNYYDRLAAIPRLEVLALLLCLATGALVVALLLGSRRPGEATVGAALPLLGLGVVAQALAPTAAFPIAWPLLLGGIAAALGEGRAGKVAKVVAAAVGGGYLLGLGFFLLQAVGPDLPVVATLPLLLIAVLLLPLMPVIERGAAGRVGAALLVLAVTVALWVRWDAVAPSVAVYSSFGAPH